MLGNNEGRIIQSLIIHKMVDEDYLSKEQLSGINNFLLDFSVDTLKVMARDLKIDLD